MKTILLLIASLSLASCGFTYSDGSRSGIVQNVSHKGFICKTWKAEIVLDGFRPKGQEGATSNVFVVHIPNNELVNKLKEAESSGEKVTIEYDQALVVLPCTQESKYTVKNVTSIVKK